MFFSTRNKEIRITASEAILKGISEDGGLFLPLSIPFLQYDKSFTSLSYKEIAFKVLRLFLDDFTDKEIKDALNKAYDKSHFEEKIMDVNKLNDKCSIMELYHGETLTFKDMALSLLPYLMEIAKKKHPNTPNIKILTATSGDTGSAVLSSFSKVNNIDVRILYPKGGIAQIQEKQMLYFTNDHARAYSLKNSNFDTCQTLVKKLLIEGEHKGFTSANSINIGRLLPQIVYYYYSYNLLVKKSIINYGDYIDVIVPTGNFGDIFAGYLAKQMSLPINKLVVASNENNVLTDFFNSGKYDLHRDFIKTNSPSMDILISSNLERLLFYTLNSDKKVTSLMNNLKENKVFEIDSKILETLKGTFSAYYCNKEETFKSINECYSNYNVLLDPHTSVSYYAYKLFKDKEKSNCHSLIIATASPLKFPETICEAFSISYKDYNDALHKVLNKTNINLPESLNKVLNCKTEPFEINEKDVKNEIFNKHKFIVSTNATSANLGPGFDVLGVSINLKNTFSFEPSLNMETVNFGNIKKDDNLVLYSYCYAFKKIEQSPLHVKITQIKNDIPLSRGLGSSASCIIAGLTGANLLLNNKFTKEQIYNMAIEIEGHPDNIAPCLYGGVVLNLLNEGVYEPYFLNISSKLKFLLIIPDEKISTNKAREILPKEYPLSAIKNNVSHIALLPLALKNGDLDLLRKTLIDKIHVPYRKTLINDYEIVENIMNKYNIPFTISGSGSTMIAFYLKGMEKEIDKLKSDLNKENFPSKVTLIDVSPSKKGVSIKKEILKNE